MSNSALLIVDMVYDFTNPDGLVYYPQNREILPKIAKALEVARQKGTLIVFLQHRYRKGKFDKNLINMRINCIEGTGGEAIDDSLTVLESDYVIPKRRYSGFFGTDLDLVLRENNIKKVFVTGTKTNCCIRATVTDAYNLDYETYVIRDCVATNDETVNEVHLTDINKYLGKVINLEDMAKFL